MSHLFYTKQSKPHGHFSLRALNNGERDELCLTWLKTNSGIQTSGVNDPLNGAMYIKRPNEMYKTDKETIRTIYFCHYWMVKVDYASTKSVKI